MATEIENISKGEIKVKMSVDCPCEIGICEHALVEVNEALQQAYTRGVKDGATGAMTQVKKYLKEEYPEEFAKAERAALGSKTRAN